MASLIWFQLQFPAEVTPEAATAALGGLHGISAPGRKAVLALRVVAERDAITHYVGCRPERADGLRAQLPAHVPGLHLVEVAEPPREPVRVGAKLWLSTSRRPLTAADPEVTSKALLAALSDLRKGERVSLLWLLGPVRRAMHVPSTHSPQFSESWPRALGLAAFMLPKELDAEGRKALRSKQGSQGWRAVGRIGVTAATRRRAHALLGELVGALKTVEGPGARLGVKPLRKTQTGLEPLPWIWNLALNVSELTALSTWPLGDVGQAPVQQRRSRLLPPPRSLPRGGRVVAVSPTTDRPLTISTQDSLQHTLLLGPTGTGKSTAIIRLALQDMEAGRSVVVVDPKGDLIDDLLDRLPAHRRDHVVVLDPLDASPVGLNPLANGDPHLVADQILSVIAKLNSDSWGPRLSELLHAALLSLAMTPKMTLAALPLLLTNDAFRRRLVAALDDPLGVAPVWAWYESLSDEARQQARAAVLNKIRPLVGRPALRAVLGQSQPKFSLSDLFTQRRILLVRLDKGRLGPESARLLGTLLVNQLWQTTLSRSAIAPQQRHPVMVYLDELQDFTAIPVDLAECLSQSRGLGVAWHLATQFLDQLSGELQAAVLSQCRSRVLFQLTYKDAAVLARGHRELSPEDLTELPAREVYLRLVSGSAVTPYMSGKTLPAPATTGGRQAIIERSRERYGTDRKATDEALRTLVEPPRGQPPGPMGVRRRPS